LLQEAARLFRPWSLRALHEATLQRRFPKLETCRSSRSGEGAAITVKHRLHLLAFRHGIAPIDSAAGIIGNPPKLLYRQQ
jgi:hypothetical protein